MHGAARSCCCRRRHHRRINTRRSTPAALYARRRPTGSNRSANCSTIRSCNRASNHSSNRSSNCSGNRLCNRVRNRSTSAAQHPPPFTCVVVPRTATVLVTAPPTVLATVQQPSRQPFHQRMINTWRKAGRKAGRKVAAVKGVYIAFIHPDFYIRTRGKTSCSHVWSVPRSEGRGGGGGGRRRAGAVNFIRADGVCAVRRRRRWLNCKRLCARVRTRAHSVSFATEFIRTRGRTSCAHGWSVTPE